MARTLLTLAAAALLLASASPAAAQSSKALTIEYPKVGQVCLGKAELEDAAKRMRELIVPEGAAVTLITYSDGTEVTRKRPGLTSPCISHLVPEGIKDHERVATFRALQVAEIAEEVGLESFRGTPMLVLGGDLDFRQRDNAAFAIIPRRSQGSSTADRRVEVWISDPASFAPTQRAGAAATAGTIMTPILLPPMAYAGGGNNTTVYEGGSRRDPTIGHGQRVAGWTFVSLALAAAVGSTLSFIQSGESEDLSRQTLDTEQSIEFQDDADRFRQVGNWSAGVGVGFAVLGTILLLTTPDLDIDDDEDTTSSLGVSPSLDGQGAMFNFSSEF